MSTVNHVLVLAVCLAISVLVTATPSPDHTCKLDKCMKGVKFSSQHNNDASSFCESYISSTPGTRTATRTTTVFTTITSHATPPVVTVLALSTKTATISVGRTCSTTITIAFPYSLTTSIAYQSQSHITESTSTVTPPAKREEARHGAPPWMTNGCTGHTPISIRISSACSCFLTSKTIKSTSTITKTHVSTTANPTPTTTVTSTITSKVTNTYCSYTTTITVTNTFKCGMVYTAVPTASTFGSVTCAPPAASPSTNGFLRVEGNDVDGTIFEDCIVAGPRNITTPSGGTHLCDSTNNGANPSPNDTPTDMIDQAAKQDNFDYDGTYSESFQDYFITRISTTAQTSTQFWGALSNYTFIPVGGCQYALSNGDVFLWAFDAFNAVYFLKTYPEYAIATAGHGSIVVTVLGEDGNGGSTPLAGAVIAGRTTDQNGQATIPIPSSPGCYQYKATYSNATSIRSNAFYLSVFPSFG